MNLLKFCSVARLTHIANLSRYKLRNALSASSFSRDPDDILQKYIQAAKSNNEPEAEEILAYPEFTLVEVKDGTDSLGNSPLMLAAQRNWSDSCQSLIDIGCDVDHQNVFGSTALMCSAAQGHTDALETLLRCDRLDINLSSRFGQTALMKAILAGRIESVKILLDAGAATEIHNKQGKSTLDLAYERGHDEIISIITALKS